MMYPSMRGSVTFLVLIFAGIFIAVLGALSGYLLSINHSQDAAYAKAQALLIAEAGLTQERLFLTQNPLATDPDPSPVPYTNLEGKRIGSYTISLTQNTNCPDSSFFEMSAVGTTDAATDIQGTVSELYIPPAASVAFPPDCTPSATSTSPRFLGWQEE